METTKILCLLCESPFVTPVPPAGLLDTLATLISFHSFQCEACKKRFRIKLKEGQASSAQDPRRKSIRLPVQIPVTFESNEASGEGTLTDMSLHGCTLETKEPQQALRSGLVIKLNLPASAAGKSTSSTQQLATIMGVNGNRIGLKFLTYSFQERDVLTQTVTKSVRIFAREK